MYLQFTIFSYLFYLIAVSINFSADAKSVLSPVPSDGDIVSGAISAPSLAGQLSSSVELEETLAAPLSLYQSNGCQSRTGTSNCFPSVKSSLCDGRATVTVLSR